MPLAIPDGYAEVTVVWSLAGDPENQTVRFGVLVDDPATAQDVADESYEAFATWQATWGSSYSLLATEVVFNDASTIREALHLETTNSGAAASNPPQNVAFLVKKQTGVAGRANRGRFYFPPGRLAEVDINNFGIIDAADLSQIQDELDALYQDLVTATSITDVVVLHTDPLATPTIITSFVGEATVATQRRRLRS